MDTLFTLCKFEVPQIIPLEGSITYSGLSKKVKLHQRTLTRCLRMVMTIYFFAEPKPGYVAHTFRSKELATNEAMRVRSVSFITFGTSHKV